MKNRRKKGFSLIELIVVIAVIAAIATIVLPQFSDFTTGAKAAATARSVQGWNTAYLNWYAAQQGMGNTGVKTLTLTGVTLADVDDPDTVPAAVGNGGTIPALTATVELNGQTMTFACDAIPSVSCDAAKSYTFTWDGGWKLP